MNFFRNAKNIKILVLALFAGFFFLTASVTLTMQPQPAEAICCEDCCMCVISTFMADLQGWLSNFFMINIHIFVSLLLHQMLWFDWTFWQQYLLPAFQMMGNQLSAVGTQQVMAVGMFMDAKNQLESQRLLQELQAQAHKDYHPSRGVCEFGTRVQSLAASERKGEINSLLLSERSLDRYLGGKSTFSAQGSKDDVSIRLKSFRDVYCDVGDNDESLDVVCPDLANTTQAERGRLNNDIDYPRVLENPWTLDFDLTNSGTPTNTEKDIVALSDNLYGYKSFSRIGAEKIKNGSSNSTSEIQEAYLDMRALVAKIKVAENSFNALVAMKSAGTQGSREFIESYLEELGIPEDEVDELLGENPSYYAQMEVLTKKAYQTPLFYTNLYDKPANIDRKEVAIQAIGLMQKFDLWKSHLRTEASLSILLELTVERLQREVEDNILALSSAGKVR